MVWHFWREIPDDNANAELVEFVVMPNHMHGIIGIKYKEEKSVRTLHATSVQFKIEIQL